MLFLQFSDQTSKCDGNLEGNFRHLHAPFAYLSHVLSVECPFAGNSTLRPLTQRKVEFPAKMAPPLKLIGHKTRSARKNVRAKFLEAVKSAKNCLKCMQSSSQDSNSVFFLGRTTVYVKFDRQKLISRHHRQCSQPLSLSHTFRRLPKKGVKFAAPSVCPAMELSIRNVKLRSSVNALNYFFSLEKVVDGCDKVCELNSRDILGRDFRFGWTFRGSWVVFRCAFWVVFWCALQTLQTMNNAIHTNQKTYFSANKVRRIPFN